MEFFLEMLWGFIWDVLEGPVIVIAAFPFICTWAFVTPGPYWDNVDRGYDALSRFLGWKEEKKANGSARGKIERTNVAYPDQAPVARQIVDSAENVQAGQP